MTLIQNALRFFSANSAKARTPMIKFRKGAATAASGAGHGSAVSGAAPKTSTKKGASQQTVIVTELPPRFHRQPISEEEIEYINRGGPA